MQKYKENWAVFPFSKEQIDRHTELEHAELDACAFEVMWRLLPPRTVYVKPSLSGLLYSHFKGEQDADGEQVVSDFLSLVRRADLLLMPIFGPEGAKHWTLLAAQRVDACLPVRAPEQARDSVPTGCYNCKNSSCANCSPDAMKAKGERLAKEGLLLEQRRMPVLHPDGGGWTFRYYETLHNLHDSCYVVASRMIQLLQPGSAFPPRQNTTRQENSD